MFFGWLMHLDAAAFARVTSILPARRSFPDWRMPSHAEQRLLSGSEALSGMFGKGTLRAANYLVYLG